MTHPLVSIWLQFALCAAVIAVAGARLSRYGDVIADKTGLSGSWIGLILLATVTSLPELATGISAVALAGVPDIAVGNVLGSCMVNLAMLALLDFLYRRASLYRSASQGHILSAGFGIVVVGAIALSLTLRERLQPFAIGHVGAVMPLVALLYFIAVRVVTRYERAKLAEFAEKVADRYPDMTLAQAAWRYALAAAVVVAAGIWLPFVAERLALAMHWHGSFVGTLFVAIVTTLPEMAVTIAAVRLNAIDMAMANLLGSNLFNMLILAIDDVFYRSGPLLSHVSASHAGSAVSVLLMTGLVIIGLIYRPGVRLLRTVGWVSIGLIALYLFNAYLLYRYE